MPKEQGERIHLILRHRDTLYHGVHGLLHSSTEGTVERVRGQASEPPPVERASYSTCHLSKKHASERRGAPHPLNSVGCSRYSLFQLLARSH